MARNPAPTLAPPWPPNHPAAGGSCPAALRRGGDAMGGIGELRIFWGPPHPRHPRGCPYQLRFGVPWPRRGGGSLRGDMEAGGCTERARPQPRGGRGGQGSGYFAPPGATLTCGAQRGEAEPQGQRRRPAARHAGPGQPSRFLPKSQALPAGTGAGSGSGWGGTIAGCGGREVTGAGMDTNCSAEPWRRERPVAVAPAAPRGSGVGGRHQLTNLIH